MLPLARSIRPTLRSLTRRPTFLVATVLTLALGMGAATAIFTLLERVVLDPLPYPQADRLVRLKNPVPGVGVNTEWELSTAQYFYFTAHAKSLAEIGLFNQGPAILMGGHGAQSQRVMVADVTATMFDLLGARPVQGRMIDGRDDTVGAPPVAVLSYDFWRREFGGSTGAVGRTLQINGQHVQVVGVMAAGVELPGEPGQTLRTATDIWMPRQLNPAGPFYNSHVNPAIARLAPGATPATAQTELARLTPQLAAAFPVAYSPSFFSRFRFHTIVVPLRAYVVGRVGRYLWILFGAVGLVLAIACANVVNLLLVRLEVRRREFAVRTALGARSRDHVADAFREALVLTALGAALAFGLAYASVHWLVTLAPPGLPRLENLRLDGRVFLFTSGLGLVIAAVLALLPVAQGRAASTVAMLGDGGRTSTIGVERRRMRAGLVVGQVALALMLLVSAGLLLRSFARLRAVDPGINPQGVLVVDVYLPPQGYDSAYKAWQFYARVLSGVRAIPGVTGAGFSSEIPFEGGYGCTVQGFEDQAVYQRVRDANETTCAGQEAASPGYFRAMGIPVLRGRTFDGGDNDHPEGRAVVVSKAFADRFWPGENPIGKGVGPGGQSKPPFYHVVGMVGDVHAETVDSPPAIAIYYPMVSNGDEATLVVRTSKGSPLSYLSEIRRVIMVQDPTVALANAEDMTTIVARSMGQLTFTMTLLAIAGITALLLAAVGLYGVMSYLVTRRTNEIGVRLALGAAPAQVERLVVWGALGLTAGGLVLGTLGALIVSRVLSGLIFGVRPWDPTAYGGAAAALASVALLAGWIPARRAASVDPAVALRSE